MAAPAQDGSICVGCGLCCDGTLHGYTTVNEEDEVAVAGLGLALVHEHEKPSFLQPCPHFSGGGCSVYADRPGVCRRYRCALLKRVEAGSIGSDEARERIKMAKKLRSAVSAAAPDARTPAARADLAKQLKAELPNLKGKARSHAARLLLDLAALHQFLECWFRSKSKAEPPTEHVRSRADASGAA